MASVYKRKSGSYCVRVSNGMKDGRQVSVSRTFKPRSGESEKDTKKRLKIFTQELEAAVARGNYCASRSKYPFDITLAEYAEVYFQKIEQTHSYDSVELHKAFVKNTLVPTFGSLRLIDINADHRAYLHRCLSSTGARMNPDDPRPLSKSTVKRDVSIFSSLMTSAYQDGIVKKDALYDHYVTISKRQEVTDDSCTKTPYDEAEAQILLDALKKESSMVNAFFSVALFTGMRRAEILALRWKDIDFEHGIIHVNHSLSQTTGHPQTLKEPKTQSGIRDVYFCSYLKSTLLTWKEEQQRLQARHLTDWTFESFVFAGATGKVWNKKTPSDLIKKIEAKAGLRPLNLHYLRHTAASLAQVTGASLYDIKQMLGHSSIQTTMLYLDSYKASQKAIATNIENALLGGTQE